MGKSESGNYIVCQRSIAITREHSLSTFNYIDSIIEY